MSEIQEEGNDFTPNEVAELAAYVRGFAHAEDNAILLRAGEALADASAHVCIAGVWCCHNGNDCTSDHK